MSTERTPVLSVAIPVYEWILTTLHETVNIEKYPHLNHAIITCIDKIQKYVDTARKSRIYSMSMCTYIYWFIPYI
jgi:hypothetical protein